MAGLHPGDQTNLKGPISLRMALTHSIADPRMRLQRVALTDFLIGGLSDLMDGTFKTQCLSGQWMITVQQNVLLSDFQDHKICDFTGG